MFITPVFISLHYFAFSLHILFSLAISNSASPEITRGLGGPEEDHQLYHCCWTGRVGEQEEEDPIIHQNTSG